MEFTACYIQRADARENANIIYIVSDAYRWFAGHSGIKKVCHTQNI